MTANSPLAASPPRLGEHPGTAAIFPNPGSHVKSPRSRSTVLCAPAISSWENRMGKLVQDLFDSQSTQWNRAESGLLCRRAALPQEAASCRRPQGS